MIDQLINETIRTAAFLLATIQLAVLLKEPQLKRRLFRALVEE
jgi:hypothetical protein